MLPILRQYRVETAIQVTPSIMGVDNAYGIEVAGRFPQQLFVLARLDVLQPNLHAHLAKLFEADGVIGVRLTVFREQDAGILESRGFTELLSAALEADAVIGIYAPASLGVLSRQLEHCPDVRLWIDHAGLAVHPTAPDPRVGLADLQRLATFPRTMLKLSGLPEVSRQCFPFDDVRDVLDTAVSTFGVSRLLWGSDYPNILKKCSYGQSLEFMYELANGLLSPDDLDQVFWKNARDAIPVHPGALG
jgi:predicted TIM-barrel fold metal-dependent hydrolase